MTFQARYPAAPLRGRTLFDQRWTDLAFLHWAVDAKLVAPLLPPGTRPDEFDGATYLGLVPFRMRKAGPGRGAPVPYFGDFLEANVRLYSVDEEGRHGVVFRSLDCSRLATTLLARAIGFPYCWSRMRRRDGVYTTQRRWPRPAGSHGPRSRIRLRTGDPTTATPLEEFLTARWGAHSQIAGRTFFTPNFHEPWPLLEAELLELDDGLVTVAGLPRRTPEPTLRVLWSPGVHARFGRPVRVRY